MLLLTFIMMFGTTTIDTTIITLVQISNDVRAKRMTAWPSLLSQQVRSLVAFSAFAGPAFAYYFLTDFSTFNFVATNVAFWVGGPLLIMMAVMLILRTWFPIAFVGNPVGYCWFFGGLFVGTKVLWTTAIYFKLSVAFLHFEIVSGCTVGSIFFLEIVAYGIAVAMLLAVGGLPRKGAVGSDMKTEDPVA